MWRHFKLITQWARALYQCHFIIKYAAKAIRCSKTGTEKCEKKARGYLCILFSCVQLFCYFFTSSSNQIRSSREKVYLHLCLYGGFHLFCIFFSTELYKKLSCTPWWIRVPDLASLVLQQLLTYQFLYFQQKFCFHSNFIETKIHPIFTIRLHFTQKVVGKNSFSILHQNCLHIKKHVLRKFKKVQSRGFGATLIIQNIKVAPKPFDRFF